MRNFICCAIVIASAVIAFSPGDRWGRTPNQDQPANLLSQVTRATASTQPTTITTLEQSVLAQINQYRVEKGLQPLIRDETVSQQARLHSQAMANRQVPFSHQGFEQRLQVINQSRPYRQAAENVAFNQGYRDPGQQAIVGWLRSEGHRRNIEGNFDITGIGIAQSQQGEFFFTQIFIRRQ